MRLLNATTYRLEEFFGKNIPKYAILSHRWESEEVTFPDLQSWMSGGGKTVQDKAGWVKIAGCCKQALKEGYNWVWVDTCCIDKSSSAELSEAINSMFNWYKNAEMCYAYLSDVPAITKSVSISARKQSFFGKSKWFTRGWTLQELLAPKEVMFYADGWTEIGKKSVLFDKVATATGIEATWIRDHLKWRSASVAQKMSWASKRETTRVEDKAYSLMGMFGVNMPLLYGEEDDAFVRLQNEIMRISDDETIFAWDEEDDYSGGLLARSSTAFQNCGHIFQLDSSYDTAPFSMTNKGIRLEVSLIPSEDPSWPSEVVDDTYIVPIECRSKKSECFALRLRRLRGNQFVRMERNSLVPIQKTQAAHSDVLKTIIFVLQGKNDYVPLQGPYSFDVPTSDLNKAGFKMLQSYAPLRCMWTDVGGNVQRLSVSTLGRNGAVSSLKFSRHISGVEEKILLFIEIYEHSVKAEAMILRRDFDFREMTESLKTPGWLSNLSSKDRERLFGFKPNILTGAQRLNIGLQRLALDKTAADGEMYMASVTIGAKHGRFSMPVEVVSYSEDSWEVL